MPVSRSSRSVVHTERWLEPIVVVEVVEGVLSQVIRERQLVYVQALEPSRLRTRGVLGSDVCASSMAAAWSVGVVALVLFKAGRVHVHGVSSASFGVEFARLTNRATMHRLVSYMA